jgi:putative tryptophan/tyrosine transport system substrate-binding protein
MHIGALLVSADPFLFGVRTQLVTLAARLSLPTMFITRDAVESGGLMSYGISIPEGYRQSGEGHLRTIRGMPSRARVS